MNKHINLKLVKSNFKLSFKLGILILDSSSCEGEGGMSGFSFVMKKVGAQNNIFSINSDKK